MLAPRPARWLVAASLLIALALIVGCGGGRRPAVGDGPDGPVQRGLASWYGKPFHGRRTASGEVYDMYGLTAAHRALPLGTTVEVRHLENGRSVVVRINDRGPFVRGRIIDLSLAAARALDMEREGVAKIELRVIAPPAAAAQAAGQRFVVQIGAFADRDNALAVKLALEGEHPDVRVVTRDGLHRVHIGAFRRKKDAEALRRTLRRRGYDAWVVSAPRASSATTRALLRPDNPEIP